MPMFDETKIEKMAKALAEARKEADAEAFKSQATEFGSQLYHIYDGLCESGFTPEQAMQIVLTVLRGNLNAD